MDEAKLTRTLNLFAAKIEMLECEIVALRTLLQVRRSITQQEFSDMVFAVVEQRQAVLAPQKTDAEKLDDWLAKFGGTEQ